MAYMRLWRKFRLFTLAGILWTNVLVILLMAFSALVQYVSPSHFPRLSVFIYAFPILLALNTLFLAFWLILRKFLAALFPIVGMVLCFNSVRTFVPINIPVSPPSNTPSISILSYNVKNFNSCIKQGGESLILQYLRDSGADIICLQEYAFSGNKREVTSKDIDKYLADWPYRSVAPMNKSSRVKLACFSKFPILSVQSIDYASESNGSVAYEILCGEDTLLVVNNHLESNKLCTHEKEKFEGIIQRKVERRQVLENIMYLARRVAHSNSLRAPQADSVSSFVQRSRHSYKIVCGDFNDIPVSYTHHAMCRGLKDAFRESGIGFGVSFHESGFFFHIDNILVSKSFRSYNCRIERTIKDSDHYPIRCQLVKKP